MSQASSSSRTPPSSSSRWADDDIFQDLARLNQVLGDAMTAAPNFLADINRAGPAGKSVSLGPPYQNLTMTLRQAGTPQNPDVFYTLTRGSRGERNYRQGVVRYRVADAVWSICRPTYPTPPMILQTLGTTISVASGSDDTREKMKEWLRGLRPDQVANLVENGVEFEYSTTLYTAGGIAYQARLVCNSEVGEIARGRHSRRSRMLRVHARWRQPDRSRWSAPAVFLVMLKLEGTAVHVSQDKSGAQQHRNA